LPVLLDLSGQLGQRGLKRCASIVLEGPPGKFGTTDSRGKVVL
jgi:hypothetical protein